MSAFIVDKCHIDALVSAGLENRSVGIYVNTPDNGPEIQVRQATAEIIGQALLDLNHASVNNRYREGTNPPVYEFRQLDTDVFTPVMVLSLIAGYRYQACEIPGWADTLAGRYLEALEHVVISELPGYDDAPWHLTEEIYQSYNPKRIYKRIV